MARGASARAWRPWPCNVVMCRPCRRRSQGASSILRFVARFRIGLGRCGVACSVHDGYQRHEPAEPNHHSGREMFAIAPPANGPEDPQGQPDAS